MREKKNEIMIKHQTLYKKFQLHYNLKIASITIKRYLNPYNVITYTYITQSFDTHCSIFSVKLCYINTKQILIFN